MKKLNSSTMFKLFSVVIAVFLWFMAMEDLNPSRTLKYSSILVDTYGLKDGLVLNEDVRKLVDVEVSGRRSELSRVNKNDLNLNIDLSKYGVGKHKVRLRDITDFNHGDVVIKYSPEYININIEKKMNRVYDIEANIVGSLPSNYDRQSISLSANSCTVEGPESKVLRVYKVVATVDAKSIENNSEIDAELIPLDIKGKKVEGVTMNTDSVKMYLPVEKSLSVKINPNLSGEPGEGFEVDKVVISPETVNLTKNSDDAEDVASIELESFDISGISENTEKSVNLMVPYGYKLNSSDKALVKVLLKKKTDDEKNDTKNQEIKVLSVILNSANFSGLADNMVLINQSDLNSALNVEVEGPSSIINSVDASSIYAGVDLSGITSVGTFNVPISVRLNGNANVKIKSFQPDTVSVTVQHKESN